jgi:hypothetical protein
LAVVLRAIRTRSAGPISLGSLGAKRLDVKVAVGAAHSHSPFADGAIIGAEQKMDLVSGAAKFGAVITAQGPASDDGDLHGPFKKKAL